jgi:hypothetical protein
VCRGRDATGSAAALWHCRFTFSPRSESGKRKRSISETNATAMGGPSRPPTAAGVGASALSMASENFGYSNVRLRRVKKLQFGVVNPHELVSYVGRVC